MPARSPIATGVLLAVASAVAFGMTTPLVAHFGSGVGTVTTAALLYAGASAISALLRPFIPRSGRALGRTAVPRLFAIALFGAALAPSLLVWGLRHSGPLATSLVLNFEAAFTVLLAHAIYREPVGTGANG